MMNEDPTRETLVLEGQTWVQCENPKCLKWRAICRLHAASLGPEEPWYCYLNPNVAERDCRVPAGPQPSRQDLKRSKLTYVYSEHVEGSLVVAKLLGYPRWPAIISADTASGEYVSKNERGVVESYHVTFLGHPRTVSWIKIQDVEPFGKIGLQVKGADKFARWWKCAMKEANGLRSMSLEERLKCCTDPDVLCSDTLLPEKKNRKSKKQRLRVSSLDEKRFQEEVCMLLKQKNLEPICSPLQGRRLSLLLLYQEVCLAGGYTEVEKRQSKWNDIHKKLIGWKSVFGGKELSTYYRRVLLPYEKLKNGSRRTENEYSARQVEDGEYVSAEERENELDFNMADILMEQANSIFVGMPCCVNSENVSREPHQGTNQQLLPSEAKNYDSSEEANPRRHLINYCKNTGMHCVKAKSRLTNINSRVGKKKSRGDLADVDYSLIPDELHEMDAFID